MAWDPSPEVAVARDAAKSLGNVPMCIVVYVTDERQVGMASYGRTPALCKRTGKIGDKLFDEAMRLLSDGSM